MVERESSSINSKLETTWLLGEIFTTPLPEDMIYQDKIVSFVGDIPLRPNMEREVSHRWGYKDNTNVEFNPRQVHMLREISYTYMT